MMEKSGELLKEEFTLEETVSSTDSMQGPH